VFDLYAGVHFHKIPVFAVEQKLHRACTFVVYGARGICGGLTHLSAHFFGHRGAWGLLYEFLMASLNGAVALTQVYYVSVAVGDNLYFNVPWLREVFFNIQLRVAKCVARLCAAHIEVVFKLFFGADNSHPLAAAACRGFHNDGVAHFFGKLANFADVFNKVCAGCCGDVACLHCTAGRGFVAHFAHRLG
jgi:hypothetical protein